MIIDPDKYPDDEFADDTFVFEDRRPQPKMFIDYTTMPSEGLLAMRERDRKKATIQ